VSIYKRGEVYWYKFMWQGKLVRESTKQGNDKVARQMEAAHRTSLAKGEVGLREKKPVATVAEFCKRRFAPWAQSTCSFKTWRDFYRVGLLALEGYSPLAKLSLDAITTERIAEFASHRQAQGMQVSTVNASLRILRRVLHVAMEWGEIARVPKVKMLPGEHHREFVLSPKEEAKYLAAAPGPLAAVATVLADTGIRPEECHRLRWEFVAWVNGRHGTLFVSHGKTKAARRHLPMTPRVRNILESRWNARGKPLEGWVWPAPTQRADIWNHPASRNSM
jgi:integrase